MSEVSQLPITVSSVTPVYAGEAYLGELVSKLEQLKICWESDRAPIRLVECLFVDDGSIDNSLELLRKFEKEHSWIKIIELSRNYGQHAATVAGLCHTSSDWVVTLDEDLQHEPSQIENLFRCQSLEGADIVYGRPSKSAHGGSWRDKSSHFVKKIVAKLTATPQIEIFNSFRLIRGSIGRAAASSSSSKTYLDVAISWFTKSSSAVELDIVDKRFVEKSESGYSFLKLVKHARKLVVSSELDIAFTGLLIGLASIAVAIFLVFLSFVQKLLFPEIVETPGWTSLMIVVTFFSGIIIALLCVAIEYLNIVTLNGLGRPTFFTVDRSQDKFIKAWFAGR